MLKAGTDTSGKWLGLENVENLSELIIKECVKEFTIQLQKHGIDQSNNPAYYKAVEKTFKHFGFEQ